MDTLSKDTLFQLALDLEVPDLLRLCMTSRKLNTYICSRNEIWLEKLKQFPNYETIPGMSLKDIYILNLLKSKLFYKGTISELYSAKLLISDHLKFIPREIGFLQNLERLCMSYGDIKAIPREIGNLQNLRLLNLTDNNIKEIPIEVLKLKNLERLDISNNPIEQIPKELKQLTKLKELDLYKTNVNVRKIPKEIKNIKGLRIIIPSGHLFK